MALETIATLADNINLSSMTIPLALTSPGDCVIVVEIRGGRKMMHRLRDLGLNLGTDIRVIKNDVRGPLIIAVKEDSRLAIGRGMAHRIVVSSAPEN